MQTPPAPVTLDDRITISTPEGIELHMVLAGMGSRFIAALADTVIKSLILFVFFLFASAGLDSFAFGAGGSADASGLWGLSIGILLIFVLQSFYDIIFEVLSNGRTPGKRWSGLRVVMANGSPVTFRASAVRNFVRIIDFLPASYFAGMVAVIVTRHNQRIGDLFAGTLVIRDRQPTVTPPVAPLFRPPPAQVHPAVMTWDLSAITYEELVTVRTFLERRFSLEPAARAHLGWELASRLYPKVAGAPPDLHPEYFLESVAAGKAARG